MDALNKLLDKAREMRSCPSDAALARELHVTRGSVSNWRKGVSLPDEVACARLSDMTGEPLARVLGMIGEARAVSREAKAVWRRLATAAALMLLAGASGLPSPAAAKEGHQGLISSVSVYYVKWLFGLFRRRPALALSPA